MKKETYSKINHIVQSSVIDMLNMFEENKKLDPLQYSLLKEKLVKSALGCSYASIPYDRPEGRFESSSGLKAQVFWQKNTEYQNLTVNGKKIIENTYTEIHFTPGKRNSFDPSKITDSLANGIQGLLDLLDFINQNKFEAESIFIGKTNINMALITRRLGFEIVDQCRTPKGEINRGLKEFTVVGRLDDIRIHVEEFKKSNEYQRLMQRNQRVQLQVNPIAL
jgi:hypothetical protein